MSKPGEVYGQECTDAEFSVCGHTFEYSHGRVWMIRPYVDGVHVALTQQPAQDAFVWACEVNAILGGECACVVHVTRISKEEAFRVAMTRTVLALEDATAQLPTVLSKARSILVDAKKR